MASGDGDATGMAAGIDAEKLNPNTFQLWVFN